MFGPPSARVVARLSALAIVLLYIGLASISLSHPGLHYDEMLFVNAALGGLDGSFIAYAVHGIPLMLMPYIGAVKSFVYAPIFLLMGVSPASVRLPGILLTALSLLLLYASCRRATGKSGLALGILAVLATSPSLIAFTRFDVGPNVLELLLKAVLLALLFVFIDSRNGWCAAAMALTACLGVYNKLNFIWMINGLLVAVLVYRQPVLACINAGPKPVLRWGLVLVTIAAPYFVFVTIYFSASNQGTAEISELAPTVMMKLYESRLLLDGAIFQTYIGAAGEAGRFSMTTCVVVAMVAGAFAALTSSRRSDPVARFFWFNVVLLLTHVIQILLTPRATAPWHQVALYPFVTATMVTGVYLVLRADSTTRIRQLAYAGSVAAASAWGVWSYGHDLRAMASPVKNYAMSTAIYELARRTQSDPHVFVATDWGIHTTLLGLSGQRGKYLDLWPILASPPAAGAAPAFRSYLDPRGPYAFITKADGALQFTATKPNLFAAAEARHVRLEKIAEIPGEGFANLYEIYVPRAPVDSPHR
jgi:hypothetical protein